MHVGRGWISLGACACIAAGVSCGGVAAFAARRRWPERRRVGRGAATCAAGRSVCSGVCVDTQTDANHCGRCGLSCSTGCRSGICVLSLARSSPGLTGSPLAFALDETAVYWTEAAAQGNDARVMKVSKAGGVPETLASGLAWTGGMPSMQPTRTGHRNDHQHDRRPAFALVLWSGREEAEGGRGRDAPRHGPVPGSPR